MKSFHTANGSENPLLGKYRLKLGILTLFWLFFASNVKAQGPCEQISFSMEDLGPCEFGASYSTQTDCYVELRFILTSGEFASYTVNSDDGFMVQEISPSELWITHEFGFIPTDFHIPLFFTLPYDLNTSMTIAFDNACAQLGCEIIGGWPLTPCPGPQDASIIGVKYKECGSLPYINQTPISGWLIQLLDVDGNIIEEQLTGADGAYAFYDRPKGQYIVREAVQPGWTPKVPASGEYLINLDYSEQRIANFGNCPPQPLPCDCPTGTNPGGNIAQNGNFSGSGGFSTGYTLNNNPTLQAGEYWIGTNPSQINAGFASCGDHTTGSGNMMVVNGAANQNTSVWCQTFTMAPNSSYKFEGWIASLSGASPAQLNINFQINNVIWSQQVFAPTSTCNWEPFCFPWTNGPNPTTVTICLVNQNAATSSNDFALDDISFRRCVAPGGNLSGVVYRECDGLPYTDQPVLSDWTVQLLDTMGNLIAEQVTDSSGRYSFCCYYAPYIIKEIATPGWTPNIPASGQYTVELITGDSLVRDFGVCPGCSCDSIYMDVVQLQGSSDTATYFLNIANTGPYCFSSINIQVDTGQLLDWEILLPNWTVTPLGPNLFKLTYLEPYLPDGGAIPLRFRIYGIGKHEVKTSASLGSGSSCEQVSDFISPPVLLSDNCCPAGTIQGPELITNGDFSIGFPPGVGYISGYNFYTPATTIQKPGQYTITNASGVSTSNPLWSCVGKSGDPNDKFMLVDGALINNSIVWRADIGNIKPNTNYAFCLYAKNVAIVTGADLPNIQLWANFNVSLVATATLPDLGPWQKVGGTWFSGPNPPSNLILLVLESSAVAGIDGRDFALDCISFRECPQPCGVTISANPTPFCGTGTLSANATGVGPFTYQWSHGQNTQTINVQGLPCGTVCSVTVTCADNTTSSASYTVTDNVPPVAVCNPGVGIDLGSACAFQVSPAFVDGGSTDNCQIQSMSVSPSVITGPGCGSTTVTLTVTDFCGNTSTCTMGIQTTEGVPPTIVCPPSVTVQGLLDPLGNCLNTVTGIAPVTVSDNCALLGVAHSINNGSLILSGDASGTTFNQGSTLVTYFAADQCQNTASCSFAVTVVCPDCQCPAASVEGNELVQNGDFDNSGGFGSGYGNNCAGQLEGQYCVTNNASNANPGFSQCIDATGSGNIFVANGALTPNTDVLCYLFNNLTPNTNYIFSFYHASVSGASPAQLGVYFGGTQAGSIAQLSQNTCTWNKYCVVWNTGNNTSISVCIRNLNTQGQGNDFAIDKVSFKECSKCAPLPPGAVLWMPMDELGNGETGITSVVGGLFAISAPGLIGSGGPNPVPGKVDVSGTTLGALEFSSPGLLHASVNNDPSLNFASGPFTIDAWVNTSMGTQTEPIVTKINAQGGYEFAITGTPAAAFPTLVIGTEVLQGPPIAVGQWNFVAVVVNPPAVHFYVGGDPGGGSSPFTTTTKFLTGTPNASSNSPLRIGYNPQNPHWNITIDELEIFNTALTSQQLNQIWAADVKGKCRSVCQCGGFSKLFVRNKKGSLNQPVSCSGATVNLPCEPELGYHLSGVFHCDGGECAPDHTINWTLSGPGGIQNGSFTDNDPFFSIHLLPNWFNQAGTYTLSMSGDCGIQTCSCEVKLSVNCPNLCPCTPTDKQAFQQNVSKGFAAAVSLTQCKACFTPLALTDCETVNWYLNSSGGPYLGTTNGKQTFCYSFGLPGTYTIVMDAARIKPDGSDCDLATYTRTVSLTCTDLIECSESILLNPRFNESPTAGKLDSIGEAPGWLSGGSHEVYMLEDSTSQDGWVMGLTGNYTESGILTSEAPYCVKRSDEGMMSVRLRSMGDPIPGLDVKAGRRPPGGGQSIILYTGNTIPWPNCQDTSCYKLAELDDLLPFDDDGWYELEIPYNLSEWAALESCGDSSGGIPARIAIYISNLLSEEQQSAGPVNDGILIDQICYSGLTVGVQEVQKRHPLRIYPNPNPGTFTVEMPEPAQPGTQFRIIDLTGRLVQEQKTEPGSATQIVRASGLPAGLYFLQVVAEGKVLALEKFVKQ